MSRQPAAPPPTSNVIDGEARVFEALDERRYKFSIPTLGLAFEVDRLRREHHALVGEMLVRCALAGARTFDDHTLTIGDLNFSSTRARQDRAKYLGERANAPDLDWAALLDELTIRVLAAERTGQPAVSLRDLPRPEPDDTLEVDGLPLLARHPVILFGDGGAAKSYLALFAAGRLAERGLRVGLFDWELAGEDHRDRVERLFGPDMPDVRYVRCDRPLVDEADRLRRIVREDQLDYVIYDSIAFACDGPPEAAEVASAYFRAVRQIGVGGVHVAHVSKADGAEAKPFGSAFWHNGARATWFVRLAESMPGANQITVGLYNKKANLGAIRPAVGFEITFSVERTTFRRVDLADVQDLAAHLSVRQRMAALLRRGAMSPEAVAEQIQADQETVKRTARRYREQFIILPGGDLGLTERRA